MSQFKHDKKDKESHENELELLAPERTYRFICEDEGSRDEWIAILNGVINASVHDPAAYEPTAESAIQVAAAQEPAPQQNAAHEAGLTEADFIPLIAEMDLGGVPTFISSCGFLPLTSKGLAQRQKRRPETKGL